MSWQLIREKPAFDIKAFAYVQLVVLSLWLSSAGAQESINVYTYHKMPPHVISFEKEQGLFFDCLDSLQNERDFKFVLKYLPRKRLDKYLENNELDGIVIGVNPGWFKDKDKKKYLWTPALFQDRDEIVSNVKNPVRYNDITSLKGMKLCGVSGFYYHGIDQHIGSNGVLRLDSDSEVKCLHKVVNRSIDFTITSTYTLNYLVRENNWQDQLFVSAKPHDQYDRHILVPRSLESVYDYLAPRITDSRCNVGRWIDKKASRANNSDTPSKDRM